MVVDEQELAIVVQDPVVFPVWLWPSKFLWADDNDDDYDYNHKLLPSAAAAMSKWPCQKGQKRKDE